MTTTRTCYTDFCGNLKDYQTGDTIRPATNEEIAASNSAADLDGGRGLIQVQVPAWVGFVASIRHDQWTVEDPAGGIWWPSAEAQAEIESRDDQAHAAVVMCATAPDRGEWRS